MSASKPRFLVTGGTGFLGHEVVQRLREWADVTLLSRSEPGCLRGDLVKWDAGLDAATLRDRFDGCLHMAGLYNLRAGQLESYRNNVMATHTALVLAEKARIPNFVHVSTIAVVVGERREGGLQPDTLDVKRPFPDAYSATKAAGESIVRYWTGSGIRSRLILRPGILVGDTERGHIVRIDGPYHALDAVRRLRRFIAKLPGPAHIPGAPTRTLPLVPVDKAADAIVRLCKLQLEKDWRGVKSLYLTPRRWTRSDLLFGEIFKRYGLGSKTIRYHSEVPKLLIKHLAEWISELPREEVEYLLATPTVSSTEIEQLLGDDWCPHFEEYKEVFFRGYEEYLSRC